MEQYIGTKLIEAEPMTLAGYCRAIKQEFSPEDEKVAGYMVRYAAGYISWSPKEAFDEAYRKTAGGMRFGEAIEMAKRGHRITRKGWNGKGMFVVYQKGYPDGIPCNKQTAIAFGYKEGDLFKCRPYLQMRCADGTHQMWLASQSDILEEDWIIV